MVAPEKRNKIKGFIGTILFHALVLIAFLFMGLTYQVYVSLEIYPKASCKLAQEVV